MKQTIQNAIYQFNCDTCGQFLNQGIPITISFGYGSELDGEEYHFCSNECLLSFIEAELKKETK
jgi:hypothetical protein